MFNKTLITLLIVSFASSVVVTPQVQASPLLSLPEPGRMVNLSLSYHPAIIKGMTVNKSNPFLFDFIVDPGQDTFSKEALKQEGEKQVRYFLAALTVPAKDLWVNLSPYEKNRTINDALGKTDMGRDLLAQDYILKQLTASLIYPEKALGKNFWDKVYAKTQAMFGPNATAVNQIPVNTFNKVWIMADQAEVYEHGQTAFVTKAHLKVMLEEDYLAKDKHMAVNNASNQNTTNQIIRDVILPELEREVNEGKNFASLRQIFNAIILAGWYKNSLKTGLLNEAYANKSTINGIDLADKTIKEQIYNRYLEAYKKGVFNYVKEDEFTNTPRKYFSGGIDGALAANPKVVKSVSLDAAMSFAGSFQSLSTRFASIIPAANVNNAHQKTPADREKLALNVISNDDPILTSKSFDSKTNALRFMLKYAPTKLKGNDFKNILDQIIEFKTSRTKDSIAQEEDIKTYLESLKTGLQSQITRLVTALKPGEEEGPELLAYRRFLDYYNDRNARWQVGDFINSSKSPLLTDSGWPTEGIVEVPTEEGLADLVYDALKTGNPAMTATKSERRVLINIIRESLTRLNAHGPADVKYDTTVESTMIDDAVDALKKVQLMDFIIHVGDKQEIVNELKDFMRRFKIEGFDVEVNSSNGYTKVPTQLGLLFVALQRLIQKVEATDETIPEVIDTSDIAEWLKPPQQQQQQMMEVIEMWGGEKLQLQFKTSQKSIQMGDQAMSIIADVVKLFRFPSQDVNSKSGTLAERVYKNAKPFLDKIRETKIRTPKDIAIVFDAITSLVATDTGPATLWHHRYTGDTNELALLLNRITSLKNGRENRRKLYGWEIDKYLTQLIGIFTAEVANVENILSRPGKIENDEKPKKKLMVLESLIGQVNEKMAETSRSKNSQSQDSYDLHSGLQALEGDFPDTLTPDNQAMAAVNEKQDGRVMAEQKDAAMSAIPAYKYKEAVVMQLAPLTAASNESNIGSRVKAKVAKIPTNYNRTAGNAFLDMQAIYRRINDRGYLVFPDWAEEGTMSDFISKPFLEAVGLSTEYVAFTEKLEFYFEAVNDLLKLRPGEMTDRERVVRLQYLNEAKENLSTLVSPLIYNGVAKRDKKPMEIFVNTKVKAAIARLDRGINAPAEKLAQLIKNTISLGQENPNKVIALRERTILEVKPWTTYNEYKVIDNIPGFAAYVQSQLVQHNFRAFHDQRHSINAQMQAFVHDVTVFPNESKERIRNQIPVYNDRQLFLALIYLVIVDQGPDTDMELIETYTDKLGDDVRAEFIRWLSMTKQKRNREAMINKYRQANDRAMLNGGIDLMQTQNNTAVRKDGVGVQMELDQNMMERVKREGIQSLTPVIFHIAPVNNIWTLLGLTPPKPEVDRVAAL